MLVLIASLFNVKAVGDDYCFAATYLDLGFIGSFRFWFFDWVPTLSFLPIHLAMLFGQGGTGSFAVHAIIQLAINSVILYSLISLFSVVSIRTRILTTFITWNIIILILGTVNPLSSKLWYATHWGLTVSRFTTAILGLLIIGLILKDRSRVQIILLSLLMSQQSAPDVLAWALTFFVFFVFKNKNLSLSIKQKLISSALIQSVLSVGTVLYTKLVVTARSDGFTGSQGENKVVSFLISFARLLFHQVIDTNSPLSILVSFAISITIFAVYNNKMDSYLENNVFSIIIFSTFSSYLIIPAADAYAYGAPWHNLQLVILVSLLKTSLFYKLICKIACHCDFIAIAGRRRNISIISLSISSTFLSLTLFFPNLERSDDWNDRWNANSVNPTNLIAQTFQDQPLQGDIESDWIYDCYKKWRN
jgi:hypothetical protein